MSNVHVAIEGNLNFPEDRELIQRQVANITKCDFFSFLACFQSLC